MFNSVQYVRDLCKARKITVSQLEKDCGFANGYLNPKKMSKLPYDRAVIIAEYLDVSPELLLTGEDTKNAPTLTEKDERDIAKDLERIMAQLDSAGDLMFDGDPMTAEARESMLTAMQLGLAAAKVKNKERFTPKKYKKG